MITGYDKLQAIWRCVALGLLLVVSFHAFAPSDAPIASQSGSAFSAFTSDVALGCREQTAAQQKLRSDTPAPPVFTPSLSLAPSIAAADRDHGISWQWSTGPPIRSVARHTPLNPRAPPFV